MVEITQSPETRAVTKRLLALRARHAITAEQLADRLTDLGIPSKRFMISSLEKGRRQHLTVDELVAFARVFDVPVADLLDGVGSAAGCEAEATAPGFAKEVLVERSRVKARYGIPEVTIDGFTLPWLLDSVTVNDISRDELAEVTITMLAELVVQSNESSISSSEEETRERAETLIARTHGIGGRTALTGRKTDA